MSRANLFLVSTPNHIIYLNMQYPGMSITNNSLEEHIQTLLDDQSLEQ